MSSALQNLIDLSCFKRLCKHDFTKFDGHFSRLSKRIFDDNLLTTCIKMIHDNVSWLHV